MANSTIFGITQAWSWNGYLWWVRGNISVCFFFRRSSCHLVTNNPPKPADELATLPILGTTLPNLQLSKPLSQNIWRPERKEMLATWLETKTSAIGETSGDQLLSEGWWSKNRSRRMAPLRKNDFSRKKQPPLQRHCAFMCIRSSLETTAWWYLLNWSLWSTASYVSELLLHWFLLQHSGQCVIWPPLSEGFL